MSAPTSDPVFFFGNLNGDGHFLYANGSSSRTRAAAVEKYGNKRHIDGTLAPTRGGGAEERQGVYAIHRLDNGYTAMAWWDRTHGDTRPGCNSVVLMWGDRTADELIAALHKHWPKVVEDMTAAGITLRPVSP